LLLKNTVARNAKILITGILLRGGPLHKSALNSLERVARGADSNPACVEAQDKVHTTERILVSFTKNRSASLSIETGVLPVQINIALNREGVELPFNQSYQFEVTTVPLGLHHITS
jgi:hypothetical protein